MNGVYKVEEALLPLLTPIDGSVRPHPQNPRQERHPRHYRSAVECAYLAGLIDGEGSIMAFQRRKESGASNGAQIRLHICNTNLAMVAWIGIRWQGRCTITRRAHLGQKDIHAFVAEDRAIVPVLLDALPYLVLKRERAQLILALIATSRNTGRRGYPQEIKDRRAEIIARIQELNKKGVA